MNFLNKKTIVVGVLAIVAFFAFLMVNPFAINDAGNRTVVQRLSGEQFVQFASGVYYQGFFAKSKEWPNQITVNYQKDEADYELVDNGKEEALCNGYSERQERPG